MILGFVVSSLMVLSLVMVACGQAAVPTAPTGQTTPAASTAPTNPTTPAEEKPQQEAVKPGADVPQYGGTYTIDTSTEATRFDPALGGLTTGIYRLVGEELGQSNFEEVPPEEFNYDDWTRIPLGISRPSGKPYATAAMAESWQVSADMKSITFKIRKGVRFHNIGPGGGREMDAYDIEYVWHRYFGLGRGFTAPAASARPTIWGPPVSAKATDKWTFVVTLPTASLTYIYKSFQENLDLQIYAHEAVEKWGNIDRWDRLVMTGPFMVKDYVPGSSITVVRNPDYWKYDVQYPQNRLPYVDMVRVLIIPDRSTALAAVRTGKLDRLENLDWESARDLKKTNPGIVINNSFGGVPSIAMRLDKQPFSDIRVRRALQLAVNLRELAETYWGGIPSGLPPNAAGTPGFITPYQEWPQEVKDGYAYNPEGAKRLLKEAGYPNGFKTSLVFPRVAADADLMAILKDYWAKIGVDVELRLMESAAYNTFAYVTGGVEAMSYARFGANAPGGGGGPNWFYRISGLRPDVYKQHMKNDPRFEELGDKSLNTLDVEESMRLSKEGDLYAASQHWQIWTQPVPNSTVTQPWVKRFVSYASGASGLQGHGVSWVWIDQNLKKAMGR